VIALNRIAECVYQRTRYPYAIEVSDTPDFSLLDVRAREDASREGRQKKEADEEEGGGKKRRNWVKSAISRRSEIESRFPGRHEISEISPFPSRATLWLLSIARALSPHGCFFLLILTDRDGESSEKGGRFYLNEKELAHRVRST